MKIIRRIKLDSKNSQSSMITISKKKSLNLSEDDYGLKKIYEKYTYDKNEKEVNKKRTEKKKLSKNQNYSQKNILQNPYKPKTRLFSHKNVIVKSMLKTQEINNLNRTSRESSRKERFRSLDNRYGVKIFVRENSHFTQKCLIEDKFLKCVFGEKMAKKIDDRIEKNLIDKNNFENEIKEKVKNVSRRLKISIDNKIKNEEILKNFEELKAGGISKDRLFETFEKSSLKKFGVEDLELKKMENGKNIENNIFNEIEIDFVEGAYKGNMINGELVGFGELRDNNGDLVYEGGFEDNEFEGFGVLWNKECDCEEEEEVERKDVGNTEGDRLGRDEVEVGVVVNEDKQVNQENEEEIDVEEEENDVEEEENDVEEVNYENNEKKEENNEIEIEVKEENNKNEVEKEEENVVEEENNDNEEVEENNDNNDNEVEENNDINDNEEVEENNDNKVEEENKVDEENNENKVEEENNENEVEEENNENENQLNFEDLDWERYEGTFKKGKKDGIGYLYLKNGDCYLSEFSENKMNGYCIINSDNNKKGTKWENNKCILKI